MQHDDSSMTATEWTSATQRAAKQRSAVQREVARLLDDLAPERPPARHDAPAPDVRLHRWPGRCVLQGAGHAVSVSWFPGRADDQSLGEVVVIEWKGIVSLPGSAQRANTAAEAVDTRLFHPVERDAGGWEWRADDGRTALQTEALATYCRDLLAH